MKKELEAIVGGLLCFLILVAPALHAQAQVPHLTDFVQLTVGPHDDRNPHWSPDGTQLTWFAFNSSGWYRQIWKMNADGSGQTQLTFGSVVDEGGDWSPDGTQLVFQRWGLRGIDAFDLMVMNSDGTNVRQITSSGPSHQNPSWSHNGSRIAYEYASGTLNPEVHVLNPDGTDDIALSQNKYQPDWSPDDKQIVAAGNDGIWIINTSSPYEAQLIYTISSVSFPQFTPDGKHIVFRIGAGDLHLIDVNGNYVVQLTFDGTLDYSHDISYDGKWILLNSRVSGNDDIWKARIIMPSICTEVDIDPNTLNLKSNGEWITCYIELSAGFNVGDIDASTILLNNTIGADLGAPTQIGDYDCDGIADLMVKFDRSTVIDWLRLVDYGQDTGKSFEVNLKITGTVAGTPFEGADTVKVLLKG